VRLLAGTGSNLRAATEHSVTLLRVFLLASACIVAAGGILLSSALTQAVSDQAVADSRSSVSQYVDGVLRGELVRGGQVQVTRHASARLTDELRHNRSLVTVKVWRPDGVLAWTNRAQARIGRRFDMDGDLGEVVDSRVAVGHIDQLSGGEDAVEERLGYDHLLEVYAPILSPNGRKVLGVYEIYADPKGLEHTLASRRNMIWGDRRPGAPGALGRVGPARSGRLDDARSADPGAAPALARPARLLRAARGELARGDREPERDRRGEGPGHSRPLAARPARRPGDRSAARPDGSSSTRSGLGRSSTTSARSRCPTGSSSSPRSSTTGSTPR
jgi:hypothetical protein